MRLYSLPIKAIERDKTVMSFLGLRKITGSNELQDSIELDGLLNPIFVIRDGDKYKVIDGKKRLDVIRRLAKMSRYKRRYSKVPCVILTQEALNINIATNKPILLNDQELAFNIIKASHGQSSLAAIAKRYGCDLQVALQCLNLKNLNRDIFKLFSKGTLSLEQAAALSTLRSKKAQYDILLKLGPSAHMSKIVDAINVHAQRSSAANENIDVAASYINPVMKDFIAA